MTRHTFYTIIIGLLIISATLAYTFSPILSAVTQNVVSTVSIMFGAESVAGLRQEIFSTPLKSNANDEHAQLEARTVVTLTNDERIRVGAFTLTANERLNEAAAAKLKDMFDKQYFEHVSPNGDGPGAVAAAANYNYVVVGENLALGNFKDNAALVAAWMASKGHRENILNERFTEIGVAVGQGMFEGKKTWLAVQEFGKPASDCPTIETSLKNRIDVDKKNVADIELELQSRKKSFDGMPQTTPEERDQYNQKINEYNSRVTAYNAALKKLQAEITEYNTQVRAFNSCIKS